ncbi:CHAD domain-containing protein [Streptomyces ruber]|uniref:CHAD domain-containing protein n=2 Tax=Streptomyces TaxID=1883 RepID=A0A918BB29_9ACTN|nr:CYTH and CHAD domain-containing protein [Streptomyces ruber]GGQ55796.1 CHAD domain-containing protein [Streptomyces ruber]
MADTKREIERKYESDESGLPDLTGVAGIATVVDKGVTELDAVYYDTPDERLTASSVTLRRRTGGDDAGWHLKFPVSAGVRDEIRAPLSGTLPRTLARLVRSRVRDAELVPLVRLRSSRDLRDLLDADGVLLAEISVDSVRAERLGGGGRDAQWSEIEVELADGGDPAFLDTVDKKLRKAGIKPSAAPSKLVRALRETAPVRDVPGPPGPPPPPATAADPVLAYVRAQRDAIVALDPAVRRDLPDSVHSMRVATRRLRSTFRSYAKVLDRAVTDPVGAELRWLAEELGAGRDQEVLAERLTAALDELPRALLAGPVRTRLRTWSHARRSGSRRRVISVLDGERYLALLGALDALAADPPLLGAAAEDPGKVLGRTVRREVERVSGLVRQALDVPPGDDRDLALHEARKKAKRARYAAEAAVRLDDAFAERVRGMKALQTLLGEHQDSVMARQALREVAAQAHAAGESAFTYGVLYGREERRAAAAEAALPDAYERYCAPR